MLKHLLVRVEFRREAEVERLFSFLKEVTTVTLSLVSMLLSLLLVFKCIVPSKQHMGKKTRGQSHVLAKTPHIQVNFK